MELQRQTVVTKNMTHHTFEYIGQPVPLRYNNNEAEPRTVRDLILAIRAWFKKNNRLDVRLIFKSLDKVRQGTLDRDDMEQAFERCGVALGSVEFKMLGSCIDPAKSGIYNYVPLLNEIFCIP